MAVENNKKQNSFSYISEALAKGFAGHVLGPFVNVTGEKTVDENGIKISSEEVIRAKNSKRVSELDAAKNLVLSSVTNLNPQKTNKYQVFAEAAMRAMLRGLKSNLDYSGNEKNAKLIDKWENKIAEGELLSEALCAQMVNEFSTELAKVDPVAAKKYQDDANSSLKEVFNGIEKNSQNADERWKWQLMQIFAVFTPLGAFSIAGHVFNYLEPLSEIFGHIFSSEGIAQGIVDILTDKKLGPFAWMVEQMKVDYAVEQVLTKTPILSDLLDAASLITTSEIVHDLGGTIAPSLGSELPLILIAGAMVAYQTPDEIDHQKSSSALEAKKKAALKKLDSYPIKPQIAKKEEKKLESDSSLSSEIDRITEKANSHKKTPTTSPQPNSVTTKLLGEKSKDNKKEGGGIGLY